MQLSTLTLYAASTDVAIDRAQLIAFLASHKLIGAPLSENEFLVGDGFFQSIVFLGCSPAMALRPEDGEQYIRINVLAADEPILYAHQRARPPLCSACKAPMDDWLATIDGASDGRIECAACKQQIEIGRLYFRKRACYSQLAIQIQPVFESEAIPDQSLLTALIKAFGLEFKYAFT